MKKVLLFIIMLFPCFIFADDLKITKDIELFGNIKDIKDVGNSYIIKTSAGVYKVDKSKGIIGYVDYLLSEDGYRVDNTFNYFDLNKGIVDYNTGYYVLESRVTDEVPIEYRVSILDNNLNVLYSFKDDDLYGDDYRKSYGFNKNEFVKYTTFYNLNGNPYKYGLVFYDYKFNKLGEDSLTFDDCSDCEFTRTLSDSFSYHGPDIYSYYRYGEDDNIQIIENYELDNYKFKKNNSITDDDFVVPRPCGFVDTEYSGYSGICLVSMLDMDVVDVVPLGNVNEKVVVANLEMDKDYLYLIYLKLSNEEYERLSSDDLDDEDLLLLVNKTYIAKMDKDYNILYENRIPDDYLVLTIPDLFDKRMHFSIGDVLSYIGSSVIKTKDLSLDVIYPFNKDNMTFTNDQIARFNYMYYSSYEKHVDLYKSAKKLLDINKIDYEDNLGDILGSLIGLDYGSEEELLYSLLNTRNVGGNTYVLSGTHDYVYSISFYDKDLKLIKNVPLFDNSKDGNYDGVTCSVITVGDNVVVMITGVYGDNYYKEILILDSNGNIISEDKNEYEVDEEGFYNHNLSVNPLGGMFSNNNGLIDITGLFNRDLVDIDRDNPKDIVSKITLFNLPYKVNYNVKGEGNVILDKDKYYINDEVEINYDFEKGYELKSISIVDSNGNTIEIKDNKFIMPDGDITINAEFVKTENPFTSVFTYAGIVLLISGLLFLLYRKNLKQLK